MTTVQAQEQLKAISCNYIGWGRTEVAELSGILMDDEKIVMAVNGYYAGGFGLLCVTNLRVLIVDKKPFVLNIEDLRYDMLTEVTYGARFVIATIHMALPTRTVYFSSWAMNRLHSSMKYVQQRVMEARAAVSSGPEPWLMGAYKTSVAHTTQNTASIRSALRLSRLIMAICSVFRSPEEVNFVMTERSPFIVQKSSQRGINPYAKMPSLQRRRRYPVFYQAS